MPTASAPTHSRSNGDFLVLGEYPPNGRGCLARFCLCNGVFEIFTAVSAALSLPSKFHFLATETSVRRDSVRMQDQAKPQAPLTTDGS